MSGACSGKRDHPQDLAFADVRADLDGEPGVTLEPLLRRHRREAYRGVATFLRVSPATETPVRKPRTAIPAAATTLPGR